MQILYNNIVKYIDGEYLLDEKVYQTFATPTILTEWQLKLKYVYNYVWVRWHDDWSWTATDFFRETIIYDNQNCYQFFAPHLAEFFEKRPFEQVNIVCGVLLSAVVFLLLSLYIFIKCCICRLCCSGKKEKT